jgi:DNA repair exonuclease SbcCD ATPase subunit
MGMDRAEKLRAMLKDGMGIIADMPDRTEALATAELSLSGHEAALEIAQGNLSTAENQITDAVRSSYKQALVIMEKPLDTDNAQELQKLQLDREAKESEIYFIEQRINELETTIDDTPEPDHEAALDHSKWKSFQEDIKRCDEDLKSLVVPEAPAESVYAECTEIARASVQTLREEANKLKDKITAYGTGVCGSCGQKLPGDIDIDKLKADYEKAEAKYESFSEDYIKAHDTVSEYKREKENYDRDHERLTKRRIEISQDMATFCICTQTDLPSFDEEGYKKQVEAYSQYTTHRKELTEQQKKLAEQKSELSKLEVNIAKLESCDTTTADRREQAKVMIKAYEDVEKKISELAKRVDFVKANISSTESRIKLFRDDMEKGAANIATREILMQARDKLHVEQLPRLAAQSSIQAINRAMKKYLDMFAFPYGFRLNENLDFVVDFDSSTDHPAEILSGGEEVRAAMAMRFALMDVFSAGCGVLIIDEPTTALDKEAIGALIEVLETAATYFKSRNIKIICPTHDQQLAAIADSLVTIGEIA